MSVSAISRLSLPLLSATDTTLFPDEVSADIQDPENKLVPGFRNLSQDFCDNIAEKVKHGQYRLLLLRLENFIEIC